MKWMKKLRLINWHYFTDETIPFGRQTIITGRTGAGKSTIIDALQVLLIANQRQTRFNSAALEGARRTLISYLRGKTGTQEKSHLRESEFTSYIAAEFRDELKRESFVVGVVIDVHRDDQYIEEYFILPDCKLDDLEFVSPQNTLLTREEFRRTHNGRGAKFERNKGSYQKALLNRMGQVDSRFFEVFSRALSFKPVDNIGDFVNDFILEKKELQLDILRQNFDLHERYRHDLQDLVEQRDKLSRISEQYTNYTRWRDTALQQEYVLLGLRAEQANEQTLQAETEQVALQEKLASTQELIRLAENDKQNASAERDKAFALWQQHGTRQRQTELERLIAEHEKSKAQAERSLVAFRSSVKREFLLVQRLLAREHNPWWLTEDNETAQLEGISELLSSLPPEEPSADTTPLAEQLAAAGVILANMYSTSLQGLHGLEQRMKELADDRGRLQEEIAALEKQQLTYKAPVTNLRNILQEHFGQRSPVWVMCEEMELQDEEWRNAAEGYLNTQRFDLLVKPEVFAEALSLYEREKRRHNLDGVGLVDTEKTQAYLNKAQPGSLAEKLTTTNPVVAARLHHLLGRVMCAKDEQDLRKHHTAVTQTCMSYVNLVARQIPRERYELPYIGAGAIVRQLEIKRQDLQRVEEEEHGLKRVHAQITALNQELTEKRAAYSTLADSLHLPSTVRALGEELVSLGEELAALDVAEVEKLRARVDYWEQEQKRMDQLLQRHSNQLGGLGEKLNSKNSHLAALEGQLNETLAQCKVWQDQHAGETFTRATERLNEALRQKGATTDKLISYERNHKGNCTTRDRHFDDLKNSRHDFNLHYSFSGDIAADDNENYSATLRNIDSIDIPKYQQHLSDAQRQAEEEFRSHFLHKMREAIHLARQEFIRINSALNQFPFHQDKYRFEMSPSTQFKPFYDCIMDDALADSESLFALPEDQRGAVLHELFEKLIHGDSATQDEFTDYRKYLSFDIRVTTGNNHYYFSRVLREKSGGETQTPFYIIILAAFNQLYSDKRMRLVVFDEAFNKMDEERIQTSLRLIRQMNLQLIAAVPDEKLQHMAPEVSTTLVVTRDQYHCFVDTLQREEVDAVHEREAASGKLQTQTSLFTPQ